MKVDAAQMRLLTDYGIHQYAIGEMDQQTASMAKYITCEKLMEVNHVVSFPVFHDRKPVDWLTSNDLKACEMYGHDGLLLDDIQRVAVALSNNRVMPIWAGTSEIMLELISRTI